MEAKAGTRLSRIKTYKDDIVLSLGGYARLIMPDMDGCWGVEIPYHCFQTISFDSITNSDEFKKSDYFLPIALGKTSMGEWNVVDLTKLPHMLICGNEGFGKSICLHSIIQSILLKRRSDEVKFVLIANEKQELSLYPKMREEYMVKYPCVDDDVITDVDQVLDIFHSLNTELDIRYELLKKRQARNINEYNRSISDDESKLPSIVVIIDEYGDFMMTGGKGFELQVCRLAQLGRAVSMHIIMTTQRPTTNIVTGKIKTFFPTRIALQTRCTIDSRTVINRQGAECLLRPGDMLFYQEDQVTRVQGTYVNKENIAPSVKPEFVNPYLLPETTFKRLPEDDWEEDDDEEYEESRLDPLFEDVARYVLQLGKVSHTLISEAFCVNYERAARIMCQLENAGIISSTVSHLTEKEFQDIMEELLDTYD